MKTLSYKNPWGYLVAANIKDIENRTWKLPEKMKGQRVLIHVSAKPVPMKHESDIFTYNQWWQGLTPDQRVLLNSNTLPNSAIIGSVEFVDCVQNHTSIWAQHEAIVYSKKHGKDIIVPVWNWVLANPVLFAKPILNVKGKLSFWDFDIESEFIGIYSDGKDYSHLEVNGFTDPEHEECVMCGSNQTTITPEADICHDCGYVYT
jgi:hypothetical protein